MPRAAWNRFRHHTRRLWVPVRILVARIALPEGSRRREVYERLWGRRAKARLAVRAAYVSPAQVFERAFDPGLHHLALPEVSDPVVSIIIPVKDQLDLTMACLRSIARVPTAVPYEVILVDDASTEGTRTRLTAVENLRVVSNPTNLGFLGSSNRGAAEAKGKFLLFLNNDTVVRENWLDAFAATFADERVGLAGAKLIYPDGKLQEAGSIVWRDASGYNYGRGGDPDLPEYNFLREVDYCSGACLMVRTEIFEQLGGFDTRFSPAYYEDTDLAFAVRRMGYRTVYQPRAQVFHLEGASHGTDLEKGIKKHQEANRVKFAEKWAAELKDQFEKSQENVPFARDRRGSRKALIIDQTLPRYDMDSGSLRMDTLVRILQELGFAVVFLPHNRHAASPYRERLQARGVEVLYGRLDLAALIRQMSSELEICIASRPSVAAAYVELVSQMAPKCKFLYDTVDLHYLREARRAEAEKKAVYLKSSRAYKELELALVARSDATLMVTEEERRVIQAEDPHARVFVLPNIHEIVADPKPFAGRSGLLFMGSFEHPPNYSAVELLLTTILPLVKKEIPDAQLFVVGANPPPALVEIAPEGATLTGWVEDLEPYLQGCLAMTAPLLFGAGVKGKVTQSMSSGLPVVTTECGAEGTGMVDEVSGLIADDPEVFARKTVELCRNPELWERIARGGLEAAESFSTRAVKGRVEEILAALSPSEA